MVLSEITYKGRAVESLQVLCFLLPHPSPSLPPSLTHSLTHSLPRALRPSLPFPPPSPPLPLFLFHPSIIPPSPSSYPTTTRVNEANDEEM